MSDFETAKRLLLEKRLLVYAIQECMYSKEKMESYGDIYTKNINRAEHQIKLFHNALNDELPSDMELERIPEWVDHELYFEICHILGNAWSGGLLFLKDTCEEIGFNCLDLPLGKFKMICSIFLKYFNNWVSFCSDIDDRKEKFKNEIKILLD